MSKIKVQTLTKCIQGLSVFPVLLFILFLNTTSKSYGFESSHTASLKNSPYERIIPKPSMIKFFNGDLLLSDQIKVAELDPNNNFKLEIKSFFNKVWKRGPLRFTPSSLKTAQLILKFNSKMKSDEAYKLEIKDKIIIQAKTVEGLFRGLTSLKQLIAPELRKRNAKFKLRHQIIDDQAKHSWRGVMVDVSRHFFPIQYLFDLVDRMAYYKINRLHLHLSDDQGFRIEIKKHPNLTKYGSTSQIGGKPGGYYTQKQYKALVKYAQDRHIVVIPEVDMPGHVYAALASVPELNCKGFTNIKPHNSEKNPPRPPELYTGIGVGWNGLCLTKKESFDFATDVITELAELTPGPWIHIGGDEIKDTNYIKFIHHADSIIHLQGKITIGWEEVLQANLHKNTIAQIWKRKSHGKGRNLAIKHQAPVILSQCEYFYLDHANVEGQPRTMDWCAKDVTLRDLYTYKENPQLNTLGFESPVWTEFVDSEAELDNRLFPRLLALSERSWSQNLDFINFEERLKSHHFDMTEMGIHFYK